MERDFSIGSGVSKAVPSTMDDDDRVSVTTLHEIMSKLVLQAQGISQRAFDIETVLDGTAAVETKGKLSPVPCGVVGYLKGCTDELESTLYDIHNTLCRISRAVGKGVAR